MSPILEKLGRAADQGKIWLEYFCIPLRWDALAIGGIEDQSDAVPTDTDFLLQRINQFCMDGGAVVPQPNVLVSLVDGGSNRLFQSARRGASLPTVAGAGGYGFDLPDPRVVMGGATITATVENISGGVIDTLHLSLIGTKIFYAPGVNLDSVVGFRK